MKYNLFISNTNGEFNIFDISENQLQKAINAYLLGLTSLTLSGKTYYFEDIDEFKIYTFEPDGSRQDDLRYYLNNSSFRVENLIGYYLPKSTLAKMGKNVTYEKIGDSAYGEEANLKQKQYRRTRLDFISKARINELKSIKSNHFDLTRLIKLCNEINDNYQLENYMSVAMIARTILDHIPPIFKLDTFDQVANNYGTIDTNKSFKRIMHHLNNSLRSIADKFLHQKIRESETLPTENQVNFSQDLDVLLEEVVRILKK